MEQLKLTTEDLESIGFKEYESVPDEMNAARIYFKLKTINGYFYYNPLENVYSWYHKTIINEYANNAHLDITKKSELFVLLSCFRADFNLTL